MFFWRAKKEAVLPSIESEAAASAVAAADGEPSISVPDKLDQILIEPIPITASNVVAITTAKLSDRLAAAASKTASIMTADADVATIAATVQVPATRSDPRL